MSKRSLWEILVPAHDNDGVQFDLSHHRVWDDAVREKSSGLTILRPAKGMWVSPYGEVFRDKMIPVRVFCAEEDIDQIIELTIKHYNQEAVMAYQVSSNVKIVNRR